MTRLEHDPKRHLSRSENVTSSEHSKVRHISGTENVTSADQRMTRHQNVAWTIGRGLSLLAENKLSAQDWGACVPSRPRALTKSQSQSQHMVVPLEGPKEGKESQQVDRLGHRQVKASPKKGVASQRRRQVKTSPKKGVAKIRHSQGETSTVLPPDTHG